MLREKEKSRYEVLDHKQRLTSLLAFYLAGEDKMLFELLKSQVQGQVFDTLTKFDKSYEDLENLSYKQLSEDHQRALQAYNIPCTIVPLGMKKPEVFS